MLAVVPSSQLDALEWNLLSDPGSYPEKFAHNDLMYVGIGLYAGKPPTMLKLEVLSARCFRCVSPREKWMAFVAPSMR